MENSVASALRKTADGIDTFTYWLGRTIAFLGFATVIICFATVYLRYVMGIGYTWTQELYTWTHVFLIMLGSSYTLLKGGFVRVDIFFARASERTRAWIDLFGATCFTVPFLVTMAWCGWPFFLASYKIGERSQYEDGLGGLYILKASLLAFAALVGIQVISGICRNLAFLLGAQNARVNRAALKAQHLPEAAR